MTTGPAGREKPARERPPRERIVLSQRRGARTVRTRVEVQEQTEVGDVLVRGLIRAQLGIALRLGLAVVLLVVSIPVLGILFPDLTAITLFGIRLHWILLGAALYPAFYLAGRLYVRLAEQAENDFMRVVDGDDVSGGDMSSGDTGNWDTGSRDGRGS